MVGRRWSPELGRKETAIVGDDHRGASSSVGRPVVHLSFEDLR